MLPCRARLERRHAVDALDSELNDVLSALQLSTPVIGAKCTARAGREAVVRAVPSSALGSGMARGSG